MTSKFNQVPVFKDGLAQPVFPFTDGKTGDAYDPENSAVVRFCVYVESDYDADGDGKPDLVKAMVQVPRSAAEGNYKAATVFEARPYCSGVNADGYEHMEAVQSCERDPFDLSSIYRRAEHQEPSTYVSALDASMKADPADWYFDYSGNPGVKYYENLDNFDYYLVRGYAVVVSSGFGSLGSDGYEYVGSSYERDAFKAVVEWLHGDRTAYTDRSRTTGIRADWSNGKVAMTGRSYAGTMPFAVAVTGVPGLETIIPVAGISDWYSFLNQQGAQRYWPKEMLMSFLSYFCTSRYGDPELSDEDRKSLDDFHRAFGLAQLESGFDYSDFWKEGNYTLQADGIKCSALIVHGLHDENVSTKQFEMMMKSFEKAGKNVRLILHQGPHITPTMPNKGYGIMIDGQFYDDIVNRWVSHWLYDQDNGAENMPAVLVQSNLDQEVWYRADSWDTGKELMLGCCSEGAGTIGTDWEDAGIDPDNFDMKMCTASGSMNRRYMTEPLETPVTVQGTVRVDFTAALAGGNADEGFDAVNINSADKLSFALGSASGRQDDLKLTVLLCDLADEPFDAIKTTDAERNTVPERLIAEGGLPLGEGLACLDLKKFDTKNEPWNVVTRAYIDLCNPDSGYEPETAVGSVVLKEGEAHEYHVYLNPSRYTFAEGHRIAVVIGTEDPVNCLVHKDYKVALADSSVKAALPVTEDHEPAALFFAD